MKKLWIILLILAACAAAGIGMYWYLTSEPTAEELPATQATEETMLMEAEVIEELEQQTNGLVMFEDLMLDTMMLGKWQHATDTGWYRVYTMEPAGDDFYWGREWNTEDDIFEEDLTPYGNGWFKWKKEGDNVIEIHMTDNQMASVPHEYTVLRLSNLEMKYKETAEADKQQFNKCSEW